MTSIQCIDRGTPKT